jgi:hypothetical protein
MDDALVNSDVENAILSVLDWILYHTSTTTHHNDANDVTNHGVSTIHNEEGSEEDDDDVSNSRTGLWSNVKSWLGWNEASGPNILKKNVSTRQASGPIDDCSGVVLHVFITQEVRSTVYSISCTSIHHVFINILTTVCIYIILHYIYFIILHYIYI